MNRVIALRLIAEITDDQAASDFARAVQSRIAGFGQIMESKCIPYWKSLGKFEVSISLKPKGEPESNCEGILSALGEGWDRQNNDIEEFWAVWNPKEGNQFFHPSVCWAYLGQFPESAIQLLSPSGIF